jgi:hypothetical protein
MLAISRSLMMQPKLLVLDEPRLRPRARDSGAALERDGEAGSDHAVLLVSKASPFRCFRSIVGGTPCNGGATNRRKFPDHRGR